VFAQQNWKVSGQIRHRFEMDNKDFNSDTDANNFSFLRTRLGITFSPNEKVLGFMQVQDSRRLGEEKSTLTDGSADNLDLHQAYFKVKNIFELPVDLKVGRMEAIYGPQRLIGAVGWHNVGRSLDGALLSIHPKNAKIDLFNFKEVENADISDTGDRNIIGAYGDFKLFQNHTTQAFLIWQRAEPTSVLSRFTLGFYAKGKVNNFFHETEFAYQGGEITNIDVSAFMAALNIGYTFANQQIKPTVAVGLDFLSGDDNPADGTFKTFHTLYATNHKYYGFMDYFLNIPVHTGQLGLQDFHIKLSAKPSKQWQIALALHNFQSAEDFTLAGGSTSTAFGNEADLTVKYKYLKNVIFVSGLSVFSPGDIFDEIRGQDSSTWFYLMTIVNL